MNKNEIESLREQNRKLEQDIQLLWQIIQVKEHTIQQMIDAFILKK